MLGRRFQYSKKTFILYNFIEMQSLVNINRMVAGAKLLNIPIFITEQYPQEYLRLRLILVLQFIQDLLKGFFQCNR